MRPGSVIALVIAGALAAACSSADPPSSGPRPGTLPDGGEVLYSVSADGLLLSYETSAMRGRRPSQHTWMTQTDHRIVRRVAADGRALVIDDYHGDGRRGTYVRWSSHGHVHTARLLADPASTVALCGSGAVVYATGDGVATRTLPGRSQPISGSLQPALLECSDRGRIAALNQHGDMMLGSAESMSGVAAGMRFSDVEWSPDGDRLAACTQDGELVLLSADGTLQSTVARSDRACEAAWSPDGTRLAFTRGRRLLVVCPCGGTPRDVTGDVDASGIDAISPLWSPAGTAIAYGEVFAGVSAVAVSTHRMVVVAKEGVPVAWLDTAAARRAAALADSYPCC